MTFSPGKIVHHLAPDCCSSSQDLKELILKRFYLIECTEIHMGDHEIGNNCS